VGAEPNGDRIENLVRDKVQEIYRIGDRNKPGSILEAVREGVYIARKI
jgi:hypothetical protein